jgi:hypothetical protein
MELSASAMRDASPSLFARAIRDLGRQQRAENRRRRIEVTKLPLCFFGLGLLDVIDPLMRKAPKECGYARISLQVREILVRGQLWPVAVDIHHAKKTEWLVGRGTELVPRPRWHRDKVVTLKMSNLASDQALATAVKDEDGVSVLVSLECRKPSGCHFEKTQLRGKCWIREQHLPRDRLEPCLLILPVGKAIHAFPAAASL